MMRLHTRLRGRINNPLIIYHHVLASALCRNPDPDLAASLNLDVVTMSCGSNDGPTAEGNHV